jgi:TonB family protein
MSLIKDSEVSSVVPAAAGTPVATKPTAVEIPVTVNGARTAEGSEKREPFSETTQTVLVFGHGAIIRLGSHVAPGQLLFLTNEKSKKEVVCQVVRSKHGGGGSDYVELKFTEAAPEFWGIRFGTAPLGAAKPAGPARVGSLEQKLAELNAVPPPAAGPSPAQAPEAKRKTVEPLRSSEGKAPAAPESSSQSKLPTLSEFLAHGASGPELKAPEKAKPAEPAPAPKELAAEKAGAPGLSSVLLSKPNPAPGATNFDFAVDEVKIPAWLEPLARNATVPVPETEVVDFDSLPVEVSPAAELPVGRFAEEPAEEKREAAPVLSAAGPTPNFGSSLALDARSTSAESGGGSLRIGWKLALLVAGLLLAAAVGWYWYTTQPAHVSASSDRAAAPESVKAPEPAPVSRETSRPLTSASFEAPGSATRDSSPKPTESNTFEATSAAGRSVAASPLRPAPEAVSPPEPKKPALGKVRLSAPVVNRGAASQVTASEDPGLALGSGISGEEANSLSLLGSKSKQPAAPVPVGGDVKPARLLVSIPPVYPQLARTQRLSGDVTLDALIESNGRVASTKVLSGPALLHQAAVEAVRQWKYQPATLNGQPTAMHLTVVVQFKLQ